MTPTPFSAKWRHVLSLVALIVAGLCFLVVPLVLAGPGGLVPAYLNVIFWATIALALANRSPVALVAFFLILTAICLAWRDQEQGMLFKAKQMRELVTSKPA